MISERSATSPLDHLLLHTTVRCEKGVCELATLTFAVQNTALFQGRADQPTYARTRRLARRRWLRVSKRVKVASLKRSQRRSVLGRAQAIFKFAWQLPPKDSSAPARAQFLRFAQDFLKFAFVRLWRNHAIWSRPLPGRAQQAGMILEAIAFMSNFQKMIRGWPAGQSGPYKFKTGSAPNTTYTFTDHHT
jgi:hypothetical protein